MVALQLQKSAKPTGGLPTRATVAVNGVTIGWDEIEAEAQHHPAASAREAVRQATEALVVRSLLLQEAQRLDITAGSRTIGRRRTETKEEAAARALIEREVTVPEPTDDELHRYYRSNSHRFRSPDLVEASHILIAARRDDTNAYVAAREKAQMVLTELRALPNSFATLARIFSDCPSAGEGGRLGQILPGDTTPEFEAAIAGLVAGETATEPIAAPYGFHISRVDRRAAGRTLPFEAVAGRIAVYLTERSRRLAEAQYVARLVSAADITGCEIAGAATLRVTEAQSYERQ
jgi:peptidyl-prolyl cis-trans isomerase C